MKIISINLNDGNTIKRAIKEVREYKESLNRKMELFVSRLIDVGIERAESTGGKFAKYVTYTKKLDVSEHGCHGILLGNGGVIETSWLTKEGEKHGSLSMLWAMEFGTAAAALPAQSRFGGVGGAGTNSSTGRHNADYGWWVAVDKDAQGKIIWQRATAIEPTRPMHNAMLEMEEQMARIAKEVFDG